MVFREHMLKKTLFIYWYARGRGKWLRVLVIRADLNLCRVSSYHTLISAVQNRFQYSSVHSGR